MFLAFCKFQSYQIWHFLLSLHNKWNIFIEKKIHFWQNPLQTLITQLEPVTVTYFLEVNLPQKFAISSSLNKGLLWLISDCFFAVWYFKIGFTTIQEKKVYQKNSEFVFYLSLIFLFKHFSSGLVRFLHPRNHWSNWYQAKVWWYI